MALTSSIEMSRFSSAVSEARLPGERPGAALSSPSSSAQSAVALAGRPAGSLQSIRSTRNWSASGTSGQKSATRGVSS
jgi:hypothetical protein